MGDSVTRSDVFKILWVLGILTPLVIFQAGPGYAPAWLATHIAAVPLTVCATTIWFVIMMILAWRFAASATATAKAAEMQKVVKDRGDA